MAEIKFNLYNRTQRLLANLKNRDIRTRDFLFHSLAWLVLINGFFLTINIGFFHQLPVLFILFYFWFKLLDHFNEKLKIPAELLIILFVLLFALEMSFLKLVSASGHTGSGWLTPPGFFFKIIQYFFLTVMVLVFSLILINRKQDGKFFLVMLLLFGYIGIILLKSGKDYYWWIYAFILILFLLRRTSWTEVLSKAECWLYLLGIVILYRFLSMFGSFSGLAIPKSDHTIWYYLPHLLYYLFKYYLIALMIKLPLVLVYHHASLSRKLRFAGLFQSTFPQLIQLIMLVMIFYFFVAWWQAENVKKSLDFYLNEIRNGKPPAGLTVLEFDSPKSNQTIPVPGYNLLRFPERIPTHGVVALKSDPQNKSAPQTDYFIFFGSTDAENPGFHLVKIDSSFLKKISNESPVIAGTNLSAYPFTTTRWDSLLYRIRAWEFDSRYNQFRIFPFGFLPSHQDSAIVVPYRDRFEPDSSRASFTLAKPVLTIGRMFVPLYDRNFRSEGYFALDVLIQLSSLFFSSTIIKNLLFWLVIYFFVNYLIIRQVVKFGSQINRSIVQKFSQLKHGIRQISEGNLDYKIQLEGEDEFVELAGRFNQMGNRLQQTISEVREKDRMEYELQMAREVQLSLLPQSLPRIIGYRISAAIETANEVGGDFYDVIPLSGGKYLFVIGDVSGKSTSAAFYMAQCVSLIRYSSQFSEDPEELLVRLNHYFAQPSIDRHIFITAILGVLDSKKNEIRFFRAGHTEPFLLPGNTRNNIHKFSLPGMGIGLESGKIFKQTLKMETFQFEPGDTFVLYTDGVVEAGKSRLPDTGETENSGSTEFFGEERLVSLLKELRGHDSDYILNEIMSALNVFYESHAKIDDSTLLVIQRKEE